MIGSDRCRHLFYQQFGLGLKNYQNWLKSFWIFSPHVRKKTHPQKSYLQAPMAAKNEVKKQKLLRKAKDFIATTSKINKNQLKINKIISSSFSLLLSVFLTSSYMTNQPLKFQSMLDFKIWHTTNVNHFKQIIYQDSKHREYFISKIWDCLEVILIW